MTRFASFLRPHLASRQKSSREHPDANLLLAFTEGGLSSRERATVLTHLAECPECREVLSLSVKSGPKAVSKRVFPKAASTWWGWRLAATAAVVCLITVTVWRLPLFRNPPNTSLAKPAVSTRPGSGAFAPLSEQTIRPDEAKPQAPPSRRASRRRHATESSDRQPTAPPARAGNEPEISNQSLEIAKPQAGAKAGSLAAIRPAAPPALSRDFLMPNSTPSRAGRAAVQSFLRTPSGSPQAIWSLEGVASGGAVKKSEDGGRTWRTITIDQSTQLYAISAAGADVWAGGAAGKLFHSVDGGGHWTAISVTDENFSLAEAITGIDARGASITLTTASGATWTTEDDGVHWRRR